jgi:hypothetical protein
MVWATWLLLITRGGGTKNLDGMQWYFGKRGLSGAILASLVLTDGIVAILFALRIINLRRLDLYPSLMYLTIVVSLFSISTVLHRVLVNSSSYLFSHQIDMRIFQMFF